MVVAIVMRLVGYTTASSYTNTANVYRAEMFPGLGSLMKRTVYEQNMKNKMSECCSARSVRHRRHKPAKHTGQFGGVSVAHASSHNQHS